MGIFPPEKVREALSASVATLTDLDSVRWTPALNLHVTLKFLGSVPNSKLEELNQVLTQWSRPQPAFHIFFRGGGAFPHARRAQVLWTGLGGDVEILAEAAQALDRCLERLGIPQENRQFKPHLTMARPKSKFIHPTNAERYCKLLEQFQTPMFTVNSVQLVLSRLGPLGSQYEKLQSFPLGLAI